MNSLLNDSELKDVLADCYNSTEKFSKVMMPERFSAEFSPLHDKIIEAIDSGEPRVVIAAPRGIGKTSLCLSYLAKRILFRDARFCAYISNSATSAELQTENLKRELLSNQLIKKFFGSIKAEADLNGLDEAFSKKTWIANNHTMMLPRGAGQQIRGLLYGHSRPDIFIIDDLEDAEEVLNEELRKKLRIWFTADVIKAVSRIDKSWRFIYIDTLKHEDSLLQHLLDHPDWCSLRLEICDDNLKSNAPTFISDVDIQKEYEYHKKDGMLDVFYREFRNLPIAKETASFKPEYFRYFTEGLDCLIVEEKNEDGVVHETRIPFDDLVTVVICDPAKEPQIQNADTAIIGISVHRKSRKIFFRKLVAGKMYPDQIYDEMFQMLVMLKSWILAVEVTSLHQFISQPIENQMRVRNIHAQYIELKAVGKKEERVGHLASYYKLGHIYHHKEGFQKLESQLLAFPRPALWDCADAAAYITKLLDELALYFDPVGFDDENSIAPEDYSDLKAEPQEEWATII